MAIPLKNMSAEELMAHYTGLTWPEGSANLGDKRRKALREIMYRLKEWEVGWTG